MRYIKILQISALIAFTLASTYVGFKLYTLDAKEAIDYFVPFAMFVIGYLMTGFFYLIFRAYKGRRIKALSIQFLMSLMPLLLIPYGFMWKEAKENEITVRKMKQQEYQEYLIKLERINLTISEYPDSSILYVQRGQLKRSQGLWQESITDCQMSLKKMESTDAYWELGWCQEHLGLLEEALTSYKRAASIDGSLDWPQNRIEVVQEKLAKASNIAR